MRVNQTKYGLSIPFGHGPILPGEQYPSVMEDYRSAGTPRFIVVNPEGEVIYNDFHPDTDWFIDALSKEDLKVVA